MIIAAIAVIHSIFSVWFVHHPKSWIDRHLASWPDFILKPILAVGNHIGDLTDGLGITGHDAVYEYDLEAPAGSVLFAGEPIRTGYPAPEDIVVLDRGEFKVGWSPSLKHPVWVAYHVVPDAKFEDTGTRPDFRCDRNALNCPMANAYSSSGYDRGHMAPNHAILSRYGTDVQKQTFLMSNIAPQSPALNRRVWRDLEHRITDFWTAKYGEIWVIVGALPSSSGAKISSTGIDIPDGFYQVVVAQTDMNIRAFATLFDQNASWYEWAARNLITIDELEKTTGLDFLPELPEFIQNPLEAELPSRLWPVRATDIIGLIASRFD